MIQHDSRILDWVAGAESDAIETGPFGKRHSGRRRWHFLPREATPDARVLIVSRGVRAFTDGFVSVLLPLYLTRLGFRGLQIGGVTTATFVGSAALTLGVGLVAYCFKRRHLLFGAALLMAATGIGFTLVHVFWPLLLVAFVGTLNPSSGDVSIFLPLEQSLLPQTVSVKERTDLFARYSLIGSLAGALGALFAGVPTFIGAHGHRPRPLAASHVRPVHLRRHPRLRPVS